MHLLIVIVYERTTNTQSLFRGTRKCKFRNLWQTFQIIYSLLNNRRGRVASTCGFIRQVLASNFGPKNRPS
jgi:hypothetical protein